MDFPDNRRHMVLICCDKSSPRNRYRDETTPRKWIPSSLLRLFCIPIIYRSSNLSTVPLLQKQME
jgi:hypothetical protein